MHLVAHLLLRAAAALAAPPRQAAAPNVNACANGNNATGSTLCACVPDAAEAGHQRVITLTCVGAAGAAGGQITGVVFASLGDPGTAAGCGHFTPGSCHGDPAKAKAAVAAACVGKNQCTVPTGLNLNGGTDPCPGKPKVVAVAVTCSDAQPPFPPPPPPPGPPPPKLPLGAFSPCADPSSKWSKQASAPQRRLSLKNSSY